MVWQPLRTRECTTGQRLNSGGYINILLWAERPICPPLSLPTAGLYPQKKGLTLASNANPRVRVRVRVRVGVNFWVRVRVIFGSTHPSGVRVRHLFLTYRAPILWRVGD